MTVKPELLAPAGSEECLHAAVENGADAVYFGLAKPHNFNARGRAENIPLEKLAETMLFLHRRGIKGYLALNTLIQSDELAAVESLLKEIAAAQTDAVIIQDLGAAKLAHQFVPELPLHASTQMSLTSATAVELAATLGIRRTVLPRELSLKQIGELRRNTTLELECFLHGALCISYSGQCYASVGLGGRSANRGCCAQPCRLPYTIKQIGGQAKPILSPYDFAALPLLPKLIATGVNALKIEGRLKPPEYVAEVTAIYREAIDHFFVSENPIPNREENVRRLEQTFSRGLSVGWLEGTKPHRLVSGHNTSHRGTNVGTILEVRRDAVVVMLTDSVRCGDGLLFENTNDPEHSQGGRIYEIIRRKESVKEAGNGAKVLLTFANNSIDNRFVTENQTIWKTDDPRRQKEIQKTWKTSQTNRRILLQIRIQAAVGKTMELLVTNFLGAEVHLTGEKILEPAKKHPLTVEILREQFDRLGGTVYELETLEAEISGNPMVPLSVLGSMRREMIEKIDEFSAKSKPYPITDNTLASIRSRYDEKTILPAKNRTLHLLFRDRQFFEIKMLQNVIKTGCRSFYAELCSMDDYKHAASVIRSVAAEFVAVLPRILKPGESKLLYKIAELQPDAVLVRNFEELAFFRERNVPVIADFSLNVINDLAFYQMLELGAERLTFGFDLNEEQTKKLLQKVPPERVEQIVFGRIPLFTIEHCLWQTQFLKEGELCNKMCRTVPLEIIDRRGAVHTVRSDIFCRNIIEHSEPIESLPNVQHLRIEWDDRLGKSPEECCRMFSS